MKTNTKVIFFLTLFLFSLTICSQDRVRLGVYQDVKFATIGDDKGNTSYTIDILARFTMEGYQIGRVYSSVIMEYEGAKLAGGEYHRYSAGYAQNFNSPILNNFTLSPSVQFGIIARPTTTFTGLGNFDVFYSIGRFQVGWLNQWILRTDLENSPLRYSWLLGFNFSLNK